MMLASKMQPFLLLWVTLMAISSAPRNEANSNCEFKAIFNFGDSNSDTGGFWAAFPAQPPPYGMTFFNKPSGRATDGRLIIDFLVRYGGCTVLDTRVRERGATVLLPNTSLFVTGISPFSLAIQINQLKEFKSRVDELHSKGIRSASHLPARNIFGKSLYTFYIGQNDFTSKLASVGISGVKQFLPQVVSQIASSIKEIYAIGGKTFLMLNLAPIGCYPSFLVELPHNKSDIDEFGCMISYNKAVLDYNNMLKKALRQVRQDLPDASVIYVDTHAVLLDLFQQPTSHGLRYGTKACCGYGDGAYNYNPQVRCGSSRVINGHEVTALACNDPYNYVSWDGIHATEAANKLTAYAILDGSHFDPPFSLHKLCDIKPIG